jgi:tetratricopeptide (TPR) repeat protein
VVLGLAGGWFGLTARAAVADLLPEDKPEPARALDSAAQRQADALSWFATGLFAEESDGPEKATESYHKALALDPGNVDLAVRLSFDHLRRGETVEAISILKDTIKAAPKESAPCLALSSIYLRHLHKPELASKYAQMAMEIAPKTFAPYQALWEIYQAQNQTAKSEQLLEKAEHSKSEDATYWLSLAELNGRKLLREGGTTLTESEMQRVSRLLDKAGELGAKDPAVLNRIGDLYVLARQIEKALPYYRKVVELKPSFPNAREKLAGCYVETGQTDAAIAGIESLVKSNPLNIAAYDQLTQLYLRAENYPKALASAEQALILAPRDPVRYDQVIRLCLDQKKNDAALAHTREAIKRFPKTPVFSFFEALALTEAKEHGEAIKSFERTVVEAGNSQPDLLDADFYFSYGAAAEQAGRKVKAIELFHKSIALDPSQAARSYNYIGYMWTEKGENLEEAAQLIHRALEMDPDNGAYIDSQGWLYFKQGKFQEAFTELLRAAEALPEPDAVVYEHVGDAADKLNKHAEAVLYWQKALQLDPGNKKLADRIDKVAEKVAQKPKDKPDVTIIPQTPAP